MNDNRKKIIGYFSGHFRPWSALIFVAIYLTLLHFLGALYLKNIFAATAVWFLYIIHPKTRQFIQLMLPCLIYIVIYDSIKLFPRSWFGTSHIQDVYDFEAKWFGVSVNSLPVILCDYFKSWSSSILDIASAIVYLLQMPLFFMLAIFLFIKSRLSQLHEMSVAFFIMNMMAVLTYVLYPVAPPWYVELHGFSIPELPVMGYAAGLENFDKFFGIDLFTTVYANNPVPFGAVPSMHIGVALLTMIHAVRYSKKFFVPMFFYVLFISFAAVYLIHHYVIDLVIGAIYCYIAVWLTNLIVQSKIKRIITSRQLIFADSEKHS